MNSQHIEGIFRFLVVFSLLTTHLSLGAAYPKKSKPIKTQDVCLTKGCIRTANDFLLSMDLQVNPCENFYQYTCGNWIKKHVIREEEESNSQFSVLEDQLYINLKYILEDKDRYSLKPPFSNLIQTYEACMNESHINSLKGQPLIDALDTIMGGWPVLMKKWDPNSFNWVSVAALMNLYSKSFLINFLISADYKNNSYNRAELDQTTFGINRDYLEEDRYTVQRKAYQILFEDLVKLLNDGTLTKKQKKDIDDVIKFERKLVKITKKPEERRNMTRMYNIMTVAELRKKYVKIDFRNFFDTLLWPNITLTDDDLVNVVEVEYFEKLEELIEKTNIRIVANYLGWRFTKSVSLELSEDFYPLLCKYFKVMTGSATLDPRWQRCADYVNSKLGLSLGMLYVKHEFPPDAVEGTNDMFNKVMNAFDNTISELDWMDSKTKAAAHDKLNKMVKNVAYPKEYENPEEIQKEYELLEPITGDHFSNYLKLIKFNAIYLLQDIHKPFNKTRWSSYPAEVNAYYTGDRNTITFPAAVLQFPFFDVTRPRSLNYGAIGMFIGHEITHGFDDEGRQLDADGNLNNWWTDRSAKNFIEKAECVVDQYNHYYLPEVNLTIKGIDTQGENIADSGGLREAYMAYKLAEKEYEAEPLLPGLNFTHDQLFFLSFANVWCGSYRDESLRDLVLSNPHSPIKFRVIGALANLPEFNAAFNCPIPKHHRKRCKVW